MVEPPSSEDFQHEKGSPFHQSPQALRKLTSKCADETFQNDAFSLELAIDIDLGGEKEVRRHNFICFKKIIKLLKKLL